MYSGFSCLIHEECGAVNMFVLLQVERLPINMDILKKLDHQLSSDPDKTPLSNAANTDSEPEDMNQTGETEHIEVLILCVGLFVRPVDYPALCS